MLILTTITKLDTMNLFYNLGVNMFVSNDNPIGNSQQNVQTDYSVTSFKKFLSTELNNAEFFKSLSERKFCHILGSLRKNCATLTDNEYLDIVLNCMGCNPTPPKNEIAILRKLAIKFYEYIKQFEKDSTTLPLSEFTHQDLFVLLSCDGLQDAKEDIAEMYVLKLLEAPVKRFEHNRHWYVNNDNLELILKHHTPTQKQLVKLIKLAHPNTLMGHFGIRQMLIPKHINDEQYSKVVAELFEKEYSDILIHSWITYADHYDDHTDLTEEAIQLGQNSFGNDNLLKKLRTILSSEPKDPKFIHFSTYFEASVKESNDLKHFKQVLTKKLGADHALLKPFIAPKDSGLPYLSVQSILQFSINENFKDYLEACEGDKNALLHVLWLGATLDKAHHFDFDAVKEHIKNQFALFHPIKKEFIDKYKKQMTELLTLYKSDENPVIQDKLSTISQHLHSWNRV